VVVLNSKRMFIFVIFLIVFIISGAYAAVPEATQLNYSPSPAVPGATITVLIQIENDEGIIKEDVTVSLDNNYPFSVFGDFEKNIGTMQNYGKTIVLFTVVVEPSAENKTYYLPVTVKTKDNPQGKGKSFPILISGSSPVIKIVGLEGEVLLPGEQKELSFLLKNVGTSAAHDIIIEMQEDRTITATGTIVEREITPLGSATAYVARINPSEEAQAKIRVSVNRNAELKNYTLPLELSFRDSSGNRNTVTSYVGFKVSGAVELDATIKELASPFVAGTQNEINIELFNKGVGKADYTLVEIVIENGTVEKSRQFIGALEPNDVDSFKTKLTFNKELQTGEQEIILNIAYQDTDAQTKITKLSLPIKVYSIQDGATLAPENTLGTIIILIILIIIGYVGWKFFKKKKHK
jgi:hypothetical protein